MYILVSNSCADCGDEVSVGLFKKKPTAEQIREAEDTIGGMFCITTNVFELNVGEITAEEIIDV